MSKVRHGEALKFGWEGMKANLWPMVGWFLVYVLLTALGKLGGFIVNAAVWVAEMLMMAVFLQFSLRVVRAEGAKIEDFDGLLPSPERCARYIGSNVLLGLVVLGGLVLLIVPGIIWGLKYAFAPLIMLEEGCGFWEAMEKSAGITFGAKWDLLLFALLAFLVIVAGLICLLVGVIPAIFVAQIAYVWVYEDLRKAAA